MINIKILTDNSTLYEEFISEFGFSSYMETDDKKILFDLGETDCFLKNASNMGIDLTDLDYVVLSHGHHDHTNGLEYLIKLYNDNNIPVENRPKLLAHPEAFLNRYVDEDKIGCKLSFKELAKNFQIVKSSDVFQISNNLMFLGEVPRENNFEGKDSLGEIVKEGFREADYIFDDTAIAYKAKEGLVIIAGCSHAGICNILEYSKKVTNVDNILTIIGGFHLQWSVDEYISKISDELAKYNIKDICACHCTGERAIEQFCNDNRLNASKIGSGYEVSYD